MCKHFSCIIDKKKQVYWRLDLDSHTEIIDKLTSYKDSDDCKKFVRVEIVPKNDSYLCPDVWVFMFDSSSRPRWFSPSHEQACWDAFRVFEKQLYKIVIKNKKIVHPFKDIKQVYKKDILEKHIVLLKKWASVGDSVRASVWDSSVWASVRDSVRDSVRASVGDSVRASVWDSVRASVRDSVRDSSVWASVWGYTGSFFKLKKSQWRYTDNIKTKGYPFQSVVDLWNMGLVPSFDGTNWRLHSGKKAKVVYKIKQSKLREMKFNDE